VELPHPYSDRYFIRHRIKELPEQRLELPIAQLPQFKSEFVVVLAEPASYLCYQILPQLIAHLQSSQTTYHCILGLPFSFEGERRHKTTRLSIEKLGRIKSEFSVFSADSVRSQKEKMNLEEAYNLLYVKYLKEFKNLSDKWENEEAA
jgi:hypothetical protein